MSAASACVPARAWGQAATSGETDTRLSLLIQEYDRQGNHRTGTRGDQLSAQWLVTQMQQWRVAGSLEPFDFARVEVANAYLQERDRRLDGVPAYDAAFTDSLGVVGRLGPPGAGTEVVVVASDAADWPALRRTTKAGAIVLVSKGARPGLALQDAPDYAAPFGPPVLQVGSEEGGWLRAQVDKQADVRVVVDAKREPAQAFNVLARIRGRDPAAAPLVVSASRSGWWRATGERGGGLVCLLEAVRAVSAIRPLRDCVFAAVSGSEIGGLGLAALVDKHPELRAAAAWVALGPNLGAEGGGSLVAQSTDDGLVAVARGEAAAASIEIEVRPGPPAAWAAPAGARTVSLFATDNPHARLASDRWPDAVSIPALAKQAGMVGALVRALAAR